MNETTDRVCFLTDEQSKKKSRKSLDHGETALYIALGTNKGGVSLYSYATGKVRHNKRT